MRLRDLDRQAWERIALELNETCEEIADIQSDGAWSSDMCAAQVYELLNRAAILAQFCAVEPTAMLSQIGAARQ